MWPKAEISFTIRLVTPAFLGRADQKSEWRVPPFKHLLREWWRCLATVRDNVRAQDLLSKERRLFGGVHGDAAQRSQVEIMFEPTQACEIAWQKGTLSNPFPGGASVFHPEARRGMNIDALLYLGYGPLEYDSATRSSKLKSPPALAAGAQVRARIRCPASCKGDIETVLGLVHWLGTVGGRCRNGWGSLDILRSDESPWCPRDVAGLIDIQKDWSQCLDLEWSHALGTAPSDGGTSLLLWRTKEAFGDWKEAMNSLARLKIELRTGSTCGSPIPISGNPDKRHLLGYPVGERHKVRGWERLASQLRFKVIKERLDGDACPKYYGIAYHMPHGLPAEMTEAYQARITPFRNFEKTVWQDVHSRLDTLMKRWN